MIARVITKFFFFACVSMHQSGQSSARNSSSSVKITSQHSGRKCWARSASASSICAATKQRIRSADAKPEAGIVAQIGLGFVLLRANQTEGYVLGAGKFVHLIGLNRSRLLVSTALCEQKFRHCAMGCFRLVRP